MAGSLVPLKVKKGVDKPIASTASRTHVNIIGAIELNTMTITSEFVETVNSSTVSGFFAKLKEGYPQAEKLHIILDQSGYHRSQAVKEAPCHTTFNSTICRRTAPTSTPLSGYGR